MVRLVLYFLSLKNMEFSISAVLKVFSLGFYFDLGVALFFSFIYSVYLLVIPRKITGSFFDKFVTYFLISLLLFIAIFSFLSEFPFWEEFNTRFNFIAVDYLIYTYEVIENINQSYPIPLIVFVLISIITGIIYLYHKAGIFEATFKEKAPLKIRSYVVLPLLILSIIYTDLAQNRQAEWSNNLYQNELSKNGVFSFFAAYRSNELDFKTFYAKLPEKQAFNILKKEIIQENQIYSNENFDNIKRREFGSNEQTPNIILITIESFSAKYLSYFGNEKKSTPNYDLLAQNSIFFTNLYATGTRTVRGMEALTLCIPPTPGNSIVRRPGNDHIFSIATILKEKNYDLKFIYGGDGYFDNMNTFFGGQGFDIVDRDRGNPLSDDIKTTRFSIRDEEVSFENAWGICDEDIYRQSLKYADKEYQSNKPFFQFIMTTSNHKPYSFPDHKINLAQGTRESAVKYTDFALGKFIEEAKTKPWFSNTIFVIVADHCASSAGKWEINIEKHHIPAIIYNLDHRKESINKLCSQIDLMPTLFGYLNWDFETELYGKEINKMKPSDERALIGNYRTLGLLKNNVLTEINDKKQIIQFHWDSQSKTMTEQNSNHDDTLKNLTIAYYQTASERFSNGKMKVEK
jgi:phosphoglycerol transferase MdoB-like AlkP superfamily enzyme